MCRFDHSRVDRIDIRDPSSSGGMRIAGGGEDREDEIEGMCGGSVRSVVIKTSAERRQQHGVSEKKNRANDSRPSIKLRGEIITDR